MWSQFNRNFAFLEGTCMLLKHRLALGLTVAILGLGVSQAFAGDIKINIPRKSKLTPVQRLNREGVEAIRKHNYAKAEQLFYKAYLFDPDDAFTLNNLGYISEMQGQLDRAERFYELAAEQSSTAVIDVASAKEMKGRSMKDAVAVMNGPLQLNHANVEAVRLLSQGRAPEADMLLQKMLASDPNNIYTLNNLGVAKELEGEDQDALRYFDQAAAGQEAAAVVTTNKAWRGRQVREMAQENAKTLRDHLSHQNELSEQVAALNLRGVSAVNRNDLRTADADFRKAYSLNPNDAFTLNNIGYVAELEGDRETAQFFYDHARQSQGASATVGVATRQTAEGRKLFAVAADNDGLVATKVSQEQNVLRRQNQGPVLLRRRDNSVVEESAQPTSPSQNQPQR
jgi:Flp pilus assembly protein TadD